MQLLKTKQMEIHFAITLGKRAGSFALVGFCWCEFDFIYQFQIYFLCFQITVYWKKSHVNKANTE